MASQSNGIDRTATDEPPTLSPMPERRSKKISISSGRETMADQAMHDLQLGMISLKMSLITIFGHKHFRQKFHLIFDIFHEKISTVSEFCSYLLSNFKF